MCIGTSVRSGISVDAGFQEFTASLSCQVLNILKECCVSMCIRVCTRLRKSSISSNNILQNNTQVAVGLAAAAVRSPFLLTSSASACILFEEQHQKTYTNQPNPVWPCSAAKLHTARRHQNCNLAVGLSQPAAKTFGADPVRGSLGLWFLWVWGLGVYLQGQGT